MIPSFLPSLLHIAAVKIAVPLYNNNDIQGMVEEMENRITYDIASNNRNRSESWKKIRKVAIGKIQGIVPTSLQNTVVVLLRPIHVEFLRWIQDHFYVDVYATDNSYKNAISWASNGKINRIETARIFIQNNALSYGRFLMACTYFLEDEVLSLWNEMEDRTMYVTDSSLSVRFWVKWLEQGATAPWSQMVEEHFEDADTLPEDNPIRLSSFFHILSRESRMKYLIFLDSEYSHDDDLRWCMYYMDEKDRTKLLTEDSAGVLRSLLEWPFQNEFLLTAHILWPYLTPDSFYCVLHTLVFAYVLKDFKYYDYFHLLKMFWQASPISLRGNKQKKLIQFVEKLLNCDKDTSPLVLQEIEKEYISFFSEYQDELHQ